MKGHLGGEPEGQHSTLWKGVTDAQGGIPVQGGDRPGGLWHRHLLARSRKALGKSDPFWCPLSSVSASCHRNSCHSE